VELRRSTAATHVQGLQQLHLARRAACHPLLVGGGRRADLDPAMLTIVAAGRNLLFKGGVPERLPSERDDVEQHEVERPIA
jgi:hypothetical protein